MQLHLSLMHSKCVYLTGVCGSGKTMCYSILNSAYEHVRGLLALSKQSRSISADRKHEADMKKMFPFVNISVFNPRMYLMDEVGTYNVMLEQR